MSLRDRIVAEIEASGPMGFDRYMDLCLYDDDAGFFGSGRGAPGAAADFVTSPETSDDFAVLVGRWVGRVGAESDPTIVEVGAGSGAMLDGLLRSGVDASSLHALERSATSRRTLARRFPSVAVGADLGDLPPADTAVVVANEVLDNMPAALARRTGDGWVEEAVHVDGGVLGLVEVAPRPEVAAWCTEAFGAVATGATVTVQLAATDWIARLMGRFERVHACLIDYGATAAELVERPRDHLVRSYRRHRAAPGWIDTPGTTDLTVDVNVDAVVEAAISAGARVRVVDQRSFLVDHGAEELRDGLVGDERAAAAEGRIMDQLAARSRRVDLEAVLDPRGFGGFSVFLIDR